MYLAFLFDFSSVLPQGYTPVYQTQENRWWVSKNQTFGGLNELITYYRHNSLRGGVILQHQVTLGDWGSFNRFRTQHVDML